MRWCRATAADLRSKRTPSGLRAAARGCGRLWAAAGGCGRVANRWKRRVRCRQSARMGIYATIRGWVEFGDDGQVPLLREIAEDESARERGYRGGWTFPAEQPMWGTTAFFAACG